MNPAMNPAMNHVPRVVIAHRPTEWSMLLDRHGTVGQVRFVLGARDRNPDEVLADHDRQARALSEVESAIPTDWRRTRVTRADFASFVFEPNDIIVAVGQDGLVPNIAKYLDAQPLVGVNPNPNRYEGILVRFAADDMASALRAVVRDQLSIEERTMVRAELDDGQSLTALNEIFVGHRSHQSARYTLEHHGATEFQSSSGLIVATGTGSTGWARSISTERHSGVPLPSPDEPQLVFFVREAWPSVSTDADTTEGSIASDEHLAVVGAFESGGVAFGDGMEDDKIDIGWGQRLTVGVSPRRLHLAVA